LRSPAGHGAGTLRGNATAGSCGRTSSRVSVDGLLLRHPVGFVADGRQGLVDDLARAVDDAQRTMYFQAAPGVEREVLTEGVSLVGVEHLLRYAQRGDLARRRELERPGAGRILYRHRAFVALKLHREVEHGIGLIGDRELLHGG